MFDPKFVKVQTVEEAADLINRPHEDYPQRVPATHKAIVDLDWWGCDGVVRSFDLRNLHARLMVDRMDIAGRFRTSEVRVGSYTPPSPAAVAPMLVGLHDKIGCPHLLSLDSELIEWYREFQMIHPFEDGNGRVGGVVVAAMTYARFRETGYILAPCQ